MGVRVTGFSTPIGGLEWEYTEKSAVVQTKPIVPDKKIQVFISSICGDNGKYDNVRAALKSAIEETELAEVYTFEGKEASSLSAEDHYTLALKSSDVCVFLIDNADGVRAGVQKEIDTAKRCNIKSIFYFCNETQKEITPLQKSLLGAKYAKSKTVHTFDELSQAGARALINDIVDVYGYYCRGFLTFSQNDNSEDVQTAGIEESMYYPAPTMPKSVVEKLNKSKDFILKFVLGYSSRDFEDKETESNEIDGWTVQFLSVLLERKSIKNFNASLFLEELKKQQRETYYNVVEIRWKAIQAYFMDDVKKCVELLEQALALAKETDQPTWVILDILIDLRNQQYLLNEINNRFSESTAQKELNESKEKVYYPALDRIHESLHEKYIKGLYKKKTESPYTITFGNDFEEYGFLLASSLAISLYNGSLTHLLMFYGKLKDFLFYLSSKYDDWRFRRDLLKISVFEGKSKDVKSIVNSYPEVLNEMSAEDAAEIMEFCGNQPVSHKRFNSQLLAFGAIGYYLDDDKYRQVETEILARIKKWINEDDAVVATGQHIFASLSEIAYRVSQNELAEICCLFMERHYSRWFSDMFKFMAKRLDLNKMDRVIAEKLLNNIVLMFENKNERKEIEYQGRFLHVFRNQSIELTETLDEKVKVYFPAFYEGTYKLETSHASEEVSIEYITRCIERVKNSNETQGENGCFFGHGTRDIATMRNLLVIDNHQCDDVLLEQILSAVTDTLIVSKEGIDIKLDAISLMICIAVKYPTALKLEGDFFNKVLSSREIIEDIDNTFMLSNIDKISLRIALSLLSNAIGKDGYSEFIEGASYIQSDKATILSVQRVITEYLEIDENVVLPQMMGAVVLQNALQWMQMENLDIKAGATRILLLLNRDQANRAIVNQRMISLVENESVYIKNLVLRHIYSSGINEDTRQYVLEKCRQDPCSIVRMVCKEMEERQSRTTE